MKKSTDKDLVLAVSRSSTDAFECLFDRYSQKLYHFTLSWLKSESDSEEVVQEVFLKIWENRNQLDSDKSFKSYLFTIAFNAIKKQFNRKMKEQRHKHDVLESLAEELPDIETKIQFEKLVARLDELIARFPEKRKFIFLSRKKEGKSIAEIAAELGISEKTVKNQITEGMRSLRKTFENEGFNSLLFYYLFIS